MPRKPLGFDVVRDLARRLPDVEESAGSGGPSLKVQGSDLLTAACLFVRGNIKTKTPRRRKRAAS